MAAFPPRRATPDTLKMEKVGSRQALDAAYPMGFPEGTRVWEQKAFVGQTARYRELVNSLFTDPLYVSTVGGVIDPTLADTFATSIVSLSAPLGYTLSILKEVITNEFEMGFREPTTILRGNSIASKACSQYTRMVGSAFLRETVGDLIAEVIRSDESLEVNPRVVAETLTTFERTIEQVVASNSERLVSLVTRVLDRIVSEVSQSFMPREIKAIASVIASATDTYLPNQPPSTKATLLGGFFMLRYVNPALLCPDVFGITPGVPPSVASRRSLVLLTKILQNLSNGVAFGSKEPGMEQFNECIAANQERMTAFLLNLVEDPKATEGSESFADLFGPPSRKFDDVTGDMASLFALHKSFSGKVVQIQRALALRRFTVMKGLHNSPEPLPPYESAMEIELTLEDIQFLSLLTDLGEAPVSLKSGNTELADLSTDVSMTTAGSAHASGAASTSGGGAGGPLLTEDDGIAALHAAKFFYGGPPNRESVPVFYLILHRLSDNLLVSVELFARLVNEVMGEALTTGYAICVDMSWAATTAELKQMLFNRLFQLSKVFTREQKKCIRAIYIIHPTTFTQTLLYFASTFTSTKLRKKIHEIYEYDELENFIAPENNALPETSRHYITKAYQVVKVNAKGKAQERLIKFTPVSVLNIDPATVKIKNERHLHDILRVCAVPGVHEIVMQFTTSDTGGQSKGFFTKLTHNEADLEFRRYRCASKQDMDEILAKIFEIGFHLNGVREDIPEFDVDKVNMAGKHQQRIFKFTCDSLLNIDPSLKIKSETPFAGIEQVTKDAEFPRLLWLKFKSDDRPRKIFCSRADELYNALLAAIKQFKEGEDDELKEELAHITQSIMF